MSKPSKLSKEQIEKLDKALNETNMKQIEAGLVTPDTLYLDFSLCKDYTLGYVFQKLMRSDLPREEKKRKYDMITAGIAKWQDRAFDDFEEYYPDYGITNAEIEAGLNDPSLASYIFRYAPNTRFYATIRADLIINTNHSQVKEKYKKIAITKNEYYRVYDRIKFIINTYPLQIPKLDQDVLGKHFADLYGVDVRLIYKDPSTIGPVDVTWIQTIEHFYINKLGLWTKSEYIRTKLDDTLKYYERNMRNVLKMPDPRKNPALFSQKRIYARKIFSVEDRERIAGHDFEGEFALLTSQMAMYTEFEWIPYAYCRLVPTKADLEQEALVTAEAAPPESFYEKE